jgi:hypothetical protein
MYKIMLGIAGLERAAVRVSLAETRAERVETELLESLRGKIHSAAELAGAMLGNLGDGKNRGKYESTAAEWALWYRSAIASKMASRQY